VEIWRKFWFWIISKVETPFMIISKLLTLFLTRNVYFTSQDTNVRLKWFTYGRMIRFSINVFEEIILQYSNLERESRSGNQIDLLQHVLNIHNIYKSSPCTVGVELLTKGSYTGCQKKRYGNSTGCRASYSFNSIQNFIDTVSYHYIFLKYRKKNKVYCRS
jgi:hypothetical protein